jgi:hypothetical protein
MAVSKKVEVTGDLNEALEKIEAKVEITSPSIERKITLISEHIGHIEKNGFNAFYKFHYQSWEQVLPALREACSTFGVWVTSSIVDTRVLEGNKGNNYYEVTMRFEIIDVESKETLNAVWRGLADLSDDKAAQKAATQCYKYLVLKTFMIPVSGEAVLDSDGDAPAKPVRTASEAFSEKAGSPTPEETLQFDNLCTSESGVLDKAFKKAVLISAINKKVPSWGKLIEMTSQGEFGS